MIQWIGAAVAVLGLLYTGYKDYQNGDVQLIKLPKKQNLTKTEYPIQYCLMAYNPNVNKVYYQHEDGLWYEYAPPLRTYQNQSQKEMGTANGPQARPQGYNYGQQAQAYANTKRY